MATPSVTTLNVRNGYINQDNVVDLTTIKADKDKQCYIVDKRLLDELLSRVTQGSLESIKANLCGMITNADSKEDIFANLDNYIYLDKIVQMVNPVVTETACSADEGIDLRKPEVPPLPFAGSTDNGY